MFAQQIFFFWSFVVSTLPTSSLSSSTLSTRLPFLFQKHTIHDQILSNSEFDCYLTFWAQCAGKSCLNIISHSTLPRLSTGPAVNKPQPAWQDYGLEHRKFWIKFKNCFIIASEPALRPTYYQTSIVDCYPEVNRLDCNAYQWFLSNAPVTCLWWYTSTLLLHTSSWLSA